MTKSHLLSERNEPRKPSDASGVVDDASVTTQPSDRHIDDGTGEEETEDGLDAMTEAVRRAAEEAPTAPANDEDVPVFDRSGMPDKI